MHACVCMVEILCSMFPDSNLQVADKPVSQRNHNQDKNAKWFKVLQVLINESAYGTQTNAMVPEFPMSGTSLICLQLGVTSARLKISGFEKAFLISGPKLLSRYE